MEDDSTLAAASDATTNVAGGRTGRSTRWVMLIASVLWTLAASLGRNALFRSNTIQTDWNVLQQSSLGALSVAPLFVACAIAAWGPWRVWVRAMFLVVSVAVMAGLAEVLNRPDAFSYFPQIPPWVLIAQSYLSTFSPFASGALCLWFAGALLRIRLGPAELGPVRVTILGVMGATAILGLLTVATGTSNLWVHEAIYSQPHMSPLSSDPESMYMSRALLMVMAAGPAVALLVAFCAACSARWPMRIILVLLAIALGAVHYRFFPDGFGLRAVRTSALVAATILVFCTWVAGSIYVLDRSGWRLSRRVSS